LLLQGKVVVAAVEAVAAVAQEQRALLLLVLAVLVLGLLQKEVEEEKGARVEPARVAKAGAAVVAVA